MNIKDRLIAINECLMDGDNLPSFIIGKEYEVIDLTKDMFCVLDKYKERHWFYLDELDEFFKRK